MRSSFLYLQTKTRCRTLYVRWKRGRVADFLGPTTTATSWIGMNRKCPPVPNATHNSSGCVVFISVTIATTTTPGSTVRTSNFLYTSATCTNRRMSSSSCEHGTSHVISICSIAQSTSWPSVAYTPLPSLCKRVTWCGNKLNIYLLLSSTRNKSFQFFGIAAEGTTLLHTHLPLFCLVVPLRLCV